MPKSGLCHISVSKADPKIWKRNICVSVSWPSASCVSSAMMPLVRSATPPTPKLWHHHQPLLIVDLITAHRLTISDPPYLSLWPQGQWAWHPALMCISAMCISKMVCHLKSFQFQSTVLWVGHMRLHFPEYRTHHHISHLLIQTSESMKIIFVNNNLYPLSHLQQRKDNTCSFSWPGGENHP
jgi:hypothetical protein